MAEAAISHILQGLASVLANEIFGPSPLESLKSDIKILKELLRDSARMQAGQLINLERQIKEVIYDLEDTLESRSIKRDMSNWFTLMPGPLQREIESIRNLRIKPLQRRIQAYADLQVIQTQPTQAIKVPSVQLNKESPVRIENIFEDEAETLISYLMEKTEELDVISITGMPVLGKTMLAWKIYQDETIRKKFPNRIWVDLPMEFDSKGLYLNILREFTKQGRIGYKELVMSSSPDEEKIISAVEDCLGLKAFLLVLDGVWSADSLRSVVAVLPKTGKVLITSNNRRVCVDANVSRKPHMLRLLNEKESWNLFQLEVFGKLGGCPETLESVGECIAKKCDGSPLAIVVVASSVTPPTEASEDLTEKWWNKVSANVTRYLTEYGQQRVYCTAELSYSKLHHRLQDCFLYMGVFPEGCEISVRKLTRLWIAEGFVEQEHDQDQEQDLTSLEKTAERNLADLIDTNLVMVCRSYPNGQIRTCRLHKIMYGFCKYKAKENDFYQEIKIQGEGPSDRPPVSIRPDCRRLCIYSHPSEFLSSGPKGECVRSILCLDQEMEELPKQSYTIHKRFKFLRILEFQCMDFTYFRNKLPKLILLRYISLSCDDLKFIPEAISSLQYLETLELVTQVPSLKLKANIWRMLKLKHLVTKAAIVVAIRGNAGKAGDNLQTLTRLAPESCTQDVLGRAPNLKTLGIQGQLASLSSPESSLRKLERLENLKLVHESGAAEASGHRLTVIQTNWFPPNLRSLTLSATNLEWELMSVLGKIDSLEILKLKNNAFVGESWNTADANAFRRLGFLLVGTSDLVSWEASAHCFLALECLVLKNCKKLQKIPLTLAKSLHTLDVENVSESAVESAREIEQQPRSSLHEFKLYVSDQV